MNDEGQFRCFSLFLPCFLQECFYSFLIRKIDFKKWKTFKKLSDLPFLLKCFEIR